MSKKAKCIVILIIFFIFSIFDIGGRGFTDGLYSPLVFFLCYIFLSASTLNEINMMSLHRYKSTKDLYFQYMKNQVKLVAIYTIVFFVFGIFSSFLSIFVGGRVPVSNGAMLKFIVCNGVNLIIISYIQLIIYTMWGKVASVLLACGCVFISVISFVTRFNYVSPFIFNTAYMRWNAVKSLTILMSYMMCITILALLTFLSGVRDKKV